MLVGLTHVLKYGLAHISDLCRHIRIRCHAVMDLRKNLHKLLVRNMRKQTLQFIKSCVIMGMKRKPLISRRGGCPNIFGTVPRHHQKCVLALQYTP